MEFLLTPTTDMIEWDSIVVNSPQGSIFSESRYLRSLNHQHTCFLVKTKNNDVLAGIVVMENAHSMHRAPFPFTPYQGIMFEKKICELPSYKRITMQFRITEFIIENLIDKYANFNMALSPEFSDLRPFIWYNHHNSSGRNFNVRLRYTAHLDINNFNFNDYIKNIRGVRRQEFKKSQATIKDSDDIDEFLNAYIQTFKRQNINLDHKTIDLVQKICRGSISGGYGRLSKASVNGEIASIYLFLHDHSSAYYLFAANNPDLRSTGASTHLMLNNIEYYSKMRINKIDFIGVNSPNRGDYKISFNPRLIEYFEVELQIPNELN